MKICEVHGGVSERSIIKEFLNRADAFVLPTYYPIEAQPISIIEALNSGTPVIATNHASIPEMITLVSFAIRGITSAGGKLVEIQEELQQISK